MKSSKKVGIVSGVAVVAVVAVAAGLTTASKIDRVAHIDRPLESSTGVRITDWESAARLPLLPANAITMVNAGDQFSISKIGGLVDVQASLNGTALRVDSTEESFVITVGAVDGVGAAELILTERFSDGDEVALPFTTFTSRAAIVADPPKIVNVKVDGTRVAPWGSFGQTEGIEGDLSGPESVAVTPNGDHLLLDTVNDRVLAVANDGTTDVRLKLDGGPFGSFVQSPDRALLLAIDIQHARAVNVLSGHSIDLPAFVSNLALGTKFSLDNEGTFFVQNPGDGASYSIGRITESTLTRSDEALRDLSAPRVWVDGGLIFVQPDLSQEPLAVALADKGGTISVFDTATLLDGRVVALVGVSNEGGTTTGLVVSGVDAAHLVPLDFASGAVMRDPLTVTESGVTIASLTTAGVVFSDISL
jgi:hypothetical protein